MGDGFNFFRWREKEDLTRRRKAAKIFLFAALRLLAFELKGYFILFEIKI